MSNLDAPMRRCGATGDETRAEDPAGPRVARRADAVLRWQRDNGRIGMLTPSEARPAATMIEGTRSSGGASIPFRTSQPRKEPPMDIATSYTITLTAAEVEELLWALDRSGEHPEIRAAVDAAKPVRKRGAAKKPAPAEPYAPATGDEALDAFMRAHHHDDWRTRLANATKRTRRGMVSMPAPPPGIVRKPMSQRERAGLYRKHVISSATVTS